MESRIFLTGRPSNVSDGFLFNLLKESYRVLDINLAKAKSPRSRLTAKILLETPEEAKKLRETKFLILSTKNIGFFQTPNESKGQSFKYRLTDPKQKISELLLWKFLEKHYPEFQEIIIYSYHQIKKTYTLAISTMSKIQKSFLIQKAFLHSSPKPRLAVNATKITPTKGVALTTRKKKKNIFPNHSKKSNKTVGNELNMPTTPSSFLMTMIKAPEQLVVRVTN